MYCPNCAATPSATSAPATKGGFARARRRGGRIANGTTSACARCTEYESNPNP
jgi:hypothetical protein